MFKQDSLENISKMLYGNKYNKKEENNNSFLNESKDNNSNNYKIKPIKDSTPQELLYGAKKQEDKNEVVFWTLQLGTFNNYFNKLIDDFESNNPDIKIKWVDVPYSEGEKRTLAALLSDNPPDLINLTPDFSAMAAQKNTLYEIPKELLEGYDELFAEKTNSYDDKYQRFNEKYNYLDDGQASSRLVKKVLEI